MGSCMGKETKKEEKESPRILGIVQIHTGNSSSDDENNKKVEFTNIKKLRPSIKVRRG